MAIATLKPDVVADTNKNEPRIEPKTYKGVIYDDKFMPIKALTAYVEGAPWTVNFYSAVVSKHNDLRDLDISQPNVLQQYQKIIDYEIRVTSPLSSSYDGTTGITSVNGSGNVYSTIMPNVADYFVTDTNDNRLAIFKITNVERKTFNDASVFSVDYILVGFITEGSTYETMFTDLEAKTIRTYYFSKERLVDGLQPLVKESEYSDILSLKTSYFEIVNYFFNAFYNNETSTFIIPGQEYKIYDPYLVSFILKIVETEDNLNVSKVRELVDDDDKYLSQSNFWTCLLNRDKIGLVYCNKKMGLLSKAWFNKNTYIKGLLYSYIDYVVYPISTDSSLNLVTEANSKTVSDTVEVIDTAIRNNALVENLVVNATTYDIVKKVLTDDFYVLSQDFYNNTANQSVLEICVKDYFNGSVINMTMLKSLVEQYVHWSRLEQFYFGPILLVLIKEANKGLYT